MHTPQSTRPPAGLIAIASILALLIVGAVLFIGWEVLRTLDERFPFVANTILIALALAGAVLFVFYGGIVALGLYNRWAARRAAEADKQADRIRAEVQVAPLASSFTYHNAPQVTQSEPLALAAPIEVVKPLGEWMAWVDDQPHTLLGGRTRAGKTWLATALLERRIDSGADILIIDPHSSDWMGLPTAGGSGASERREALKAVLNEYLRRMAQREEHKRRTGHELPHDYFDPLTVLVDESNAMLEELAAEWKTVLKVISSGARKVGISLLLLAQSPLVEDLGISGAMRENFSRIALDERTVQTMIDSERDKSRKAALQAAFTTMDRSAAAQIGASTWLLDRRGLNPGSASAGAQMWAGWDFAAGKVSRVSGQNGGNTPLPDPALFGNERSNAVTSPGADSSASLPVTMTPAEAAKIATLLVGNTPSEAAKKLDGYSPRKYAEYKAKVEYVQALLKGCD